MHMTELPFRNLPKQGHKIVQFIYKQSLFGPIYVATENEVGAIKEIVVAKIFRMEHGITETDTSGARALLSQNIVNALDESFSYIETED